MFYINIITNMQQYSDRKRTETVEQDTYGCWLSLGEI